MIRNPYAKTTLKSSHKKNNKVNNNHNHRNGIDNSNRGDAGEIDDLRPSRESEVDDTFGNDDKMTESATAGNKSANNHSLSVMDGFSSSTTMMKKKKKVTITVDRLASRQVSFTSAKIVRITELYNDSNYPKAMEGKSIRVTGRMLVRQGSWILLADFGGISSNTTATTRTFPLRGTTTKTTRSPSNPYNKPQKQQPSSSSFMMPKRPSLHPRKRKRLVSIHHKNTTTTTTTSILSNKNNPSIHTQRVAAVAGNKVLSKQFHLRLTQHCNHHPKSVILVYDDIHHPKDHTDTNIIKTVEGDLLMTIGEIRIDTPPPEMHDHDQLIFQNILPIISSAATSSNYHKNNNINHTSKKIIILQARILKNVNGTDMNLYHEALLLRRKHLSMYHKE